MSIVSYAKMVKSDYKLCVECGLMLYRKSNLALEDSAQILDFSEPQTYFCIQFEGFSWGIRSVIWLLFQQQIMITNYRNKQNHQPYTKCQRTSRLAQRPLAGRIVRNTSRSIAGTSSVQHSNRCSRMLKQLSFPTNYTRPSSRNKEIQGFLDKYNQIKEKYQLIDKHLDGKMSRLDSLPNSRAKGHPLRKKDQILDTLTSQRMKFPKNSCIKSTEIKSKAIDEPKSDYSRLAKQLKNHINLQGKLRSLKHKLNQKNTEKVSGILTKKYFIMSQKCNLEVDEFDPFMVSDYQQDSEILAEQIHTALEECERNWQSRLSKSFRREEAGALFERLNFEKQNKLSLKVFVRQMSMVLNLNLRKRDLYSIFRRLGGDVSVTRNSFITALSAC